ncbi:MAG: AAA family ATPase [Kiritimatiellia bacterium]
MEHFATPFVLYLTAAVSAGLLAVALPFALWYYYRAKEIAPLLTKKKELETQNRNLEEEAGKIRSQIAGLEDKVAEARRRIADGVAAQKWIEERKNEIADLQARTIQERNEYQKVKDVFDSLNAQIQQNQTKLTAQAQLLANQQNAVDNLKREKADLEHDVTRLKGEEASLMAKVKEIMSKNDVLENKQAELTKEISRLESTKSTLSRVDQEYNDLKAKISVSEQDLSSLKSQIANAETTIARADSIRKVEADIWKDLECSVALITGQPQNTTAITDKNEEEALTAFKQALDASHFQFNERTIKAFHTGLLSGGVSPLVILSGISGTGKSLLPELYAKFFNMNFLPVAVQPRWDGPQDLFGFYNHMEGRFKATELSRLLWQFDVYNNNHAKESYTNEKLPMSLVLLDEMNLARVEYYFSELLSKLEIRNRIDNPGDEKLRKPSEIELEYGASPVTDTDTERSMARLYVGHNILFVGTMNEDESTQTLSSKVIDRSNVLRFGTPESLPQPPSMGEFQSKCSNFISYSCWQKWAKKKGNNPIDKFDEKIQSLKNALESVDRGFGHRTENAIKTYVDYYPGDKKHAFADQIEMKILPKLNGVATDFVKGKVLNSITEILQEIGADDVENALAATTDADSAFFTWKGVRR